MYVVVRHDHDNKTDSQHRIQHPRCSECFPANQKDAKLHLCRVISPWAHTPPACRSHFWCPASGPCRLWTAEWRERGKQRAKTKPSNNETHRRKEGGCRKKRRRKKGREEENTVSGFSSQETEDEVGCRKNRSGWALKPFQRRGVG